jgi:hypothetical protein
MAKSDKAKPKGKKTAKLKDLPPKPKGGDGVKGGWSWGESQTGTMATVSPTSRTLK